MKPKLACIAAEHQPEKSLLQQAGLDLEHLKGMALQNVDALVAELNANPELRNRAAALLEKIPTSTNRMSKPASKQMLEIPFGFR